MPGYGLRQPPTRPAPAFSRHIEAWLESIPPPAAKPSKKELRQWKYRNIRGLGREFFITSTVIRSLSCVLTTSVTALIGSIVVSTGRPQHALDRLLPALVVCPITALWDIAEFATACFLLHNGVRDRGIPPDIHAWVDVALFLGIATATGVLLVDVIIGLGEYGAGFDMVIEEITSVCLLVFLMIIHSFLLFFFVCSSFDRRHKARVHKTASLRLRNDASALEATRPADSRPVPELLDLSKAVTSIQVNDLNSNPAAEQLAVGVLSYQLTPTERSAAVPSPNSLLSQEPARIQNGEPAGAIRAILPRRSHDALQDSIRQDESPYAQTSRYC